MALGTGRSRNEENQSQRRGINDHQQLMMCLYARS
jgi:hypothetical protein